MLILIAYDTNMETTAGGIRLRKAVRQHINYSIRIQNSVLRCILDNTQTIKLRTILIDIIDKRTDNLGFHNLGNKHATKVGYVGVSKGIKVEGPLVF